MAYAVETLWKPGEDGLCSRDTVEATGGWPMQSPVERPHIRLSHYVPVPDKLLHLTSDRIYSKSVAQGY